jgi:alkyl-hydroperoxide reductase/thiol specific antioxidant family protein
MRWQIVYLLRDFVVAPHTFLRPKPRALPAPPEIGAKVPELPGVRLGRAAIVGFLRHVGCPFAEATVREMATLAGEQRSIDFIAVTHSDDKPSRTWCESFGGAAGVQIVADPDRARYAAWGVGLSDRQHFAGPESLGALRRLLDEGIHNRWASGNRWQAAASFAVDTGGVLRWRHFPRHAGDVPRLREAVAALASSRAKS